MGVEVVTWRTMLSLAQRVFDPIGFTCPISLRPKHLLQKCWEAKGDWNQEVSEDVKNGFLLCLRELPLLEEVRIPRWLKGIEKSVVNYSLHTFCDASKAAYANRSLLSAQNTLLAYNFSRYKPDLERHHLSS
jgi:hypothetical protein